MSARRIVLPLLALALAGGTAYLAHDWVQSQKRPAQAASEPAPVEQKAVLVAAVDLAPGQFLQAEGMRWQAWPDVSMPESYIVKGATPEDELLGAVVRQPVAAGQPLTRVGVVRPGDRGFLAAVLEPGMRAVSVPVDEASSNAGLIFPGDRVDLILTQTIGGDDSQDGAKTAARRVSETVLSNVRVIAMGRKLRNETGEEAAATDKARTTTLEVTGEGAEKVALVTELGKLSLSLRSLARPDDAPDPAGQRFTWDTDVARSLLPENQPVSTFAVIRGGETRIVNLSKGGVP
ncbi:MAG TPA: Flp pilus assembly protein CpaB [Geminicoccaceae bacterium]|nr:Flp pilus assembly protein CpaB [Geminicoccus sp.]HMU50030.1 Flp pilus assembly protein CpaB [Geminicoccaceae bacterium]